MLNANDDLFSRIWTAFETARVLPACAWCGRVRVDEGWVVPPPAALAAIDQRYTLSHSICDRCATTYAASLARAATNRVDRP
jgi:hypothetical protein